VDSPQSDHARWFAEEVLPHEPALRAHLRRRFPDLSDVDDVVQETYLKLFRARVQGRLRQARGLLFTAARHAALDVFRWRRLSGWEDHARPDDAAALFSDSAVAEDAIRAQELALLEEAIESLPRRCRQVLKLRKIYGLSHREIGAQLGISERTVNAQLGRGLRRCAAFLRARGVAVPDEGRP
jgi:RNA polymerase sigma factor (sigma-70 family)